MSLLPLEGTEVDQRLAGLEGWRRDDHHLLKEFTFGSFREAISFMVRVAFEAESLDHHPDWTNVYNRVVVRLSTHAAGHRITTRDLELAAAIERINWTR